MSRRFDVVRAHGTIPAGNTAGIGKMVHGSRDGARDPSRVGLGLSFV